MPRAFLRASGSKHVPIWPISLLVGLVASFFAFSPAAWGESSARALLGDPTVESQHLALQGGRVEAFRMHAHASGRAATLLVFVDTYVHVFFTADEQARFRALVDLVGAERDLDWVSIDPLGPLGGSADSSVLGMSDRRFVV